MEIYSSELLLDFTNYSQLSYSDFGDDYIHLLLDGKFVGYVEVWTDHDNYCREYIVINNEMIYLDNIKCL